MLVSFFILQPAAPVPEQSHVFLGGQFFKLGFLLKYE